MILEKLVAKYIDSAEQVFDKIEIADKPEKMNAEDAERVIEAAKTYLEDAKYYRDKKKFAVSLTSVAYCEGLLDALKLLGAVKFEWPTRKEEEE